MNMEWTLFVQSKHGFEHLLVTPKLLSDLIKAYVSEHINFETRRYEVYGKIKMSTFL